MKIMPNKYCGLIHHMTRRSQYKFDKILTSCLTLISVNLQYKGFISLHSEIDFQEM